MPIKVENIKKSFGNKLVLKDINLEIEDIILTNYNIKEEIILDYKAKTYTFDKSSIGDNEEIKLNHNLYALALKNNNVRKLVVELANKGFYMVDHKAGVSTFKKFETSDKFISNFDDEDVEVYNDIFYTLKSPNSKGKENRLLVIFSSVADFSLNASINRRYFYRNFASIDKYIPQNTYILRIADVGGIVGSFYLNNNFNQNIETDIQSLIEYTYKKLGINKDNVVLYGTSKGGTGALAHSIKGIYKSVSVDPLLTDQYHETKYNDCHFTKNVFPFSKQNLFSDLITSNKIHDNITIIYSNNSPLFSSIQEIVLQNDIEKKIKMIDYVSPEIQDHPDVAKYTISILLLILNNYFYEIADVKSSYIDENSAKNY